MKASTSSRIVVMAARPGRIIDELYPRTKGFRLSMKYVEHCREVSSLLDRAMAGRGGRGSATIFDAEALILSSSS